MSFFGSDDVRWLGEARVGWSELESLASPDDGQAVALVCTWRRSMRRALVAAALETCADSADCAVRVLGMAEDADAAAVAAVLDTPSVGLWARRCLRVGRLSVHDAGPAEVSYLLGLVAAAAARSGIEFELPVPVVDASLFLPTIGTADIDGTTAVVRGGPRELTIAGASTEIDVHSPDPGRTRHWHPVHHLDIRHGHGTLRVAIDDSDPYLTRLAGDEPQRLPARDRADLSVRLQQAWSWLVDNMDGHAHAISAMVQAVVPARRSGGVRSTSASSRAANGAFVVSLSADAHTLARLLVHEVQHMKLSALLDIVPLSNSGAARYRAPWRHDPRPAVALLQGVYAHVGEAAYWERRSRAYAESRRLETFEYQYVTRQAQVAIDTLVDSTDLTDAGRRFVRRLAGTLDLLQESRTATLSHAAQDLMLAREVHWRLANYIPAPGTVSRLVSCLGDRVEPAAAIPLGTPEIAPRSRGSSVRPPAIASSIVQYASSPGSAGTVHFDQAELCYIRGDYAVAIRRFEELLVDDPRCSDGWVGLALALQKVGRMAAAGILSLRPDLVAAVFEALRRAGPGDPRTVGPSPSDVAGRLGRLVRRRDRAGTVTPVPPHSL